MFKIYAKIGMILVTAPLGIVVFTFMTGLMSKLVGSLKRSSNNRREKDGRESTTPN